MKYCFFETPFKVLLGYIWSEKGLREMCFYENLEDFKKYVREEYPEAVEGRLVELEEQLERYFKGECRCIDFPLNIYGTIFQKSVWSIVRKIPYGEVRSYKWVAEQLGKPRYSRAVGRALASNPVVLVIPCHRVIRSDGSLGGYGGRRWLKEELIKFEKKFTENLRFKQAKQL
ncbi:MAG: methylated-DNA--[protein]-cysteine S-methyltransferase [Nitrososphaerota archaeon]